MRQLVRTALALAVLLAAIGADAQVNVPPPSSGNPNVIITPQAQPGIDLSVARRIKRDEANKMVKQGKAVYVDVRSNEQYRLGHIKGAISIPLSQMMGRLRDIPPKKFIITYCA
jgi:3-mercaptopyruvate sulfurtransferase SseA